MKVSTWYINCHMGHSDEWLQLPGITYQDMQDLSEIGYSGILNGERTSLAAQLDKISKRNGYSYSLSLHKNDHGDFHQIYLVSVAGGPKKEETYTRKQLDEFLSDVMNLGMKVRQDQLNGYTDKSGNHFLDEWKDKNLK